MLSIAIQLSAELLNPSHMKSSKKSEQLNLRIPNALLDDLDTIASILNVNKSEWVKIKLGEIVYAEKEKLLEQHARMQKQGLTPKKEVSKLFK